MKHPLLLCQMYDSLRSAAFAHDEIVQQCISGLASHISNRAPSSRALAFHTVLFWFFSLLYRNLQVARDPISNGHVVNVKTYEWLALSLLSFNLFSPH